MVKFTATDYKKAYETRLNDYIRLKKDNENIILTIYTAGVAVECLIRARTTHYKKAFDEGHHLENLYMTSNIYKHLPKAENIKLIKNIRIVQKYWINNLRYFSINKMIQKLSHISAGSKPKKKITNDAHKFIEDMHKEYFSAINDIKTTVGEKITWIF